MLHTVYTGDDKLTQVQGGDGGEGGQVNGNYEYNDDDADGIKCKYDKYDNSVVRGGGQ